MESMDRIGIIGREQSSRENESIVACRHAVGVLSYLDKNFEGYLYECIGRVAEGIKFKRVHFLRDRIMHDTAQVNLGA
jgi:hypothetical protein